MADFEKRVGRQPTDLMDEEWALIIPFLPTLAARGRKPATDPRDVLVALRYGLQGSATGAGAGAAQPALEPRLRARPDGVSVPVPRAEHCR